MKMLYQLYDIRFGVSILGRGSDIFHSLTGLQSC